MGSRPISLGVRAFLPAFVDQQIIAGERVAVPPRGGGGSANEMLPTGPLTIRSFDRKTGKVQWETPVPAPAGIAMVAEAAQGRVYIQVTETRKLWGSLTTPSAGFYMALNAADGKLLWKTESEPALLEAAVHGATFYTLSRSGELVAYDGKSGKVNWRTRLSRDGDPAKPTNGPLGTANLFADNDGIYASFVDFSPDLRAAGAEAKPEGGIAVLDPKSGKQAGYFNGKGLIVSESQWVGDFRVQGNLLLAAVANRGWIAIDRKTLQLQWSIFTSTANVVVSNGMLFVNTSAREENPQRIMAVDLGQK